MQPIHKEASEKFVSIEIVWKNRIQCLRPGLHWWWTSRRHTLHTMLNEEDCRRSSFRCCMSGARESVAVATDLTEEPPGKEWIGSWELRIMTPAPSTMNVVVIFFICGRGQIEMGHEWKKRSNMRASALSQNWHRWCVTTWPIALVHWIIEPCEMKKVISSMRRTGTAYLLIISLMIIVAWCTVVASLSMSNPVKSPSLTHDALLLWPQLRIYRTFIASFESREKRTGLCSCLHNAVACYHESHKGARMLFNGDEHAIEHSQKIDGFKLHSLVGGKIALLRVPVRTVAWAMIGAEMTSKRKWVGSKLTTSDAKNESAKDLRSPYTCWGDL